MMLLPLRKTKLLATTERISTHDQERYGTRGETGRPNLYLRVPAGAGGGTEEVYPAMRGIGTLGMEGMDESGISREAGT